jgi:hypothetical protein
MHFPLRQDWKTLRDRLSKARGMQAESFLCNLLQVYCRCFLPFEKYLAIEGTVAFDEVDMYLKVSSRN